jgi:hypothetical protein
MRTSSHRRLTVLSLATLALGFVLASAGLAASNDVCGELAGIEREGDIPLPVARG